jgi:HlyD family secretion protein
MKKVLVAIVGVGVVIALASFTLVGGDSDQIEFFTSDVTRGTIENAVAATGSVEAVLTVQVGSQVTGQVQALYADFNSIVRAGQLLAVLDARTFEAALQNSRASLVSARSRIRTAEADLVNAHASLVSVRASLESARVDADKAQIQFRRSQELQEAELISDTEFENARATAEAGRARLAQSEASVTQGEAQIISREAGIEQANASVVQAEADVDRAELNLEYTSIYSPVDGVVISREVDVGQTVSASTSAPTLFNIANDLAQMRVNTSVDEADIGRLAQTNDVNFTVDAYPGEQFRGRIEEIRLNPRTSQNVVTYSVIVAVNNQDLKLKPGMTANITVTTARRDDVLTVPNSALRYTPADAEHEMGQLMTRGMGGMGGRGAASSPASESRQASEGRERFRAPGGRGRREQGGFGAEGFPTRWGMETARIQGGGAGGNAPGQLWDPGDKLQFATPPETTPRPGVVWVLNSQGVPEPRMLMLGITDGTRSEVLSGDLAVGEVLLIGDSSVLEEDTGNTRQFNPFGGRMGGRMGGFADH